MWVTDKASHVEWRESKCEIVSQFGGFTLWQESNPNTFDGGRRVFVVRGAESVDGSFLNVDAAIRFIDVQ